MRLIDADALKELIVSNVYPVADYFNSRDYGMFWTGGIEKAIDEMPSIDAVQYTDDEIQRMQDIEQAQIEKAYDLGYAEGKADAVPVVRCKDCIHSTSQVSDDEDNYYCNVMMRCMHSLEYCSHGERKES